MTRLTRSSATKDRPLDIQERFKKDTVRLEAGDEVELFIKFRTFPGRFVFHCHNNEHEDSAMMLRYDVVEEEGLPEARTIDRAQIAPGVPPLPNVPSDVVVEEARAAALDSGNTGTAAEDAPGGGLDSDSANAEADDFPAVSSGSDGP
jgi:hypothetical protein